MVIICFSILSGIDCSESFHISHLYDSGYLVFTYLSFIISGYPYMYIC